MAKKIEVEEARNQKEENIPMYLKYYIGFCRHKNSEWFQTIGGTNKDAVIADIQRIWTGYDEYKLISFELPY